MHSAMSVGATPIVWLGQQRPKRRLHFLQLMASTPVPSLLPVRSQSHAFIDGTLTRLAEPCRTQIRPCTKLCLRLTIPPATVPTHGRQQEQRLQK